MKRKWYHGLILVALPIGWVIKPYVDELFAYVFTAVCAALD